MLPILAAVLAFITIGGLGWAFVGGGDSSEAAIKRAQTFGGPKQQNASAARKAAVANTPEARRKQIMDQLQESERAERKARVSLKAKLKQAGLSTTVRTFWIISAVLGVIALVLPFLFGLHVLAAVGAAVVFGLGLPRWVVGFLGKRRMKKFSSHFADAVDVIVTQDLFVYEITGEDENGKIIGRHRSTGIARPRFWDRARYYGLERELAEALDAAE